MGGLYLFAGHELRVHLGAFELLTDSIYPLQGHGVLEEEGLESISHGVVGYPHPVQEVGG